MQIEQSNSGLSSLPHCCTQRSFGFPSIYATYNSMIAQYFRPPRAACKKLRFPFLVSQVTLAN